MLGILIAARSTSSRFPGKHMATLDGTPILTHVVQLATEALADIPSAMPRPILTIPTGDQALLNYASENFLPVCQGSEEDVLERLYRAAKSFQLQEIVRITGDCPVIPPFMIPFVVGKGRQMQADYCSNVLPPLTYPDGWDVEYLSFRGLEILHLNATKSEHREHVTQLLRDNHVEFAQKHNLRIVGLRLPLNLNQLKCSVDTDLDLANLRAMRGVKN